MTLLLTRLLPLGIRGNHLLRRNQGGGFGPMHTISPVMIITNAPAIDGSYPPLRKLHHNRGRVLGIVRENAIRFGSRSEERCIPLRAFLK